jgi:glycosyltransferase involved in cell wall biosynthesis
VPEATAASQYTGEPGLNIAGYFRSENGLGEGARLLITAVEAAGIPFTTMTFAIPPSRQDHVFSDRGPGVPTYDINVTCVNAGQMPEFAGQVGPDFFRDRYTVGTWAWETEEFPARYMGAFDFVDEVWMLSDFSRDAAVHLATKPVFTVPYPVVAPDFTPGLSRDALGLPDGYLFLYSFDFLSTARRKNPVGSVEAFKRAFQPGEGPVLVIKSANGNLRADDLGELRASAAGRADIRIIDDYLAAPRNNAIIAACDCYVSLHRAEGFGLTIAAAMSLGKPAIATGYSGNLTFMTEDNSYLARYQRTTVGPACPIYPAASHWAEPDLDHAASLMRHVYEHQEEARDRGRRGQQDLEQRHSPAVRAEVVRERVDDIRRRREDPARHRWGGSWDYARPAQRAAVYVARGADTGIPTRSGGAYGVVARAIRRVMRRLLLHHDMHQQVVDLALLDSIRELEARLREVERKVPPDAGGAEQTDQALTDLRD